jgi:hypothetical protein
MSQRVCRTREIKQAKKRKISGPNLFSGTLHFIALSFPGNISVPTADLQTAIQYLKKAAPEISRYCSAYGTNSLNVSQSIIPYTASSKKYNDAMLETWAGAIAQANSIPSTDCLVFLNPQRAQNADADASQGVLGYHQAISSGMPYCFVNVMGTGLTIDDGADIYAVALSHEVAEMTVDTKANLSEPECCDPCAGNCNVDRRNYFDSNSQWISQSGTSFPPTFPYAFYVEGISSPPSAKDCPAPVTSCVYPPPAT